MLSYAYAIFLTSGPGALMIAYMLASRFQPLARYPLEYLYTATTLCAAGIGMATIGIRAVWHQPALWIPLASLIIAPPLGQFVVLADGYISNLFRYRPEERTSPTNQTRRILASMENSTIQQVRSVGIAASFGTLRRTVGPRVSTAISRPEVKRGTTAIIWLLLVAFAEELLYRGVLLTAALELPAAADVAAIILLSITFALVHISFGWSQILAKVPLATVTLAVTALSGTLAAAIVIHCYFNIYYWRKRRFTAISAAATAWSA